MSTTDSSLSQGTVWLHSSRKKVFIGFDRPAKHTCRNTLLLTFYDLVFYLQTHRDMLCDHLVLSFKRCDLMKRNMDPLVVRSNALTLVAALQNTLLVQAPQVTVTFRKQHCICTAHDSEDIFWPPVLKAVSQGTTSLILNEYPGNLPNTSAAIRMHFAFIREFYFVMPTPRESLENDMINTRTGIGLIEFEVKELTEFLRTNQKTLTKLTLRNLIISGLEKNKKYLMIQDPQPMREAIAQMPNLAAFNSGDWFYPISSSEPDEPETDEATRTKLRSLAISDNRIRLGERLNRVKLIAMTSDENLLDANYDAWSLMMANMTPVLDDIYFMIRNNPNHHQKLCAALSVSQMGPVKRPTEPRLKQHCLAFLDNGKDTGTVMVLEARSFWMRPATDYVKDTECIRFDIKGAKIHLFLSAYITEKHRNKEVYDYKNMHRRSLLDMIQSKPTKTVFEEIVIWQEFKWPEYKDTSFMLNASDKAFETLKSTLTLLIGKGTNSLTLTTSLTGDTTPKEDERLAEIVDLFPPTLQTLILEGLDANYPSLMQSIKRNFTSLHTFKLLGPQFGKQIIHFRRPVCASLALLETTITILELQRRNQTLQKFFFRRIPFDLENPKYNASNGFTCDSSDSDSTRFSASDNPLAYSKLKTMLNLLHIELKKHGRLILTEVDLLVREDRGAYDPIVAKFGGYEARNMRNDFVNSICLLDPFRSIFGKSHNKRNPHYVDSSLGNRLKKPRLQFPTTPHPNAAVSVNSLKRKGRDLITRKKKAPRFLRLDYTPSKTVPQNTESDIKQKGRARKSVVPLPPCYAKDGFQDWQIDSMVSYWLEREVSFPNTTPRPSACRTNHCYLQPSHTRWHILLGVNRTASLLE